VFRLAKIVGELAERRWEFIGLPVYLLGDLANGAGNRLPLTCQHSFQDSELGLLDSPIIRGVLFQHLFDAGAPAPAGLVGIVAAPLALVAIAAGLSGIRDVDESRIAQLLFRYRRPRRRPWRNTPPHRSMIRHASSAIDRLSIPCTSAKRTFKSAIDIAPSRFQITNASVDEQATECPNAQRATAPLLQTSVHIFGLRDLSKTQISKETFGFFGRYRTGGN